MDVAVSGVAADSLGARRIGSIAWEVARRTDVVGARDDAAIVDARRAALGPLPARRRARRRRRVAALLSGAYRPGRASGSRRLLCGANTDPADLAAPADPS